MAQGTMMTREEIRRSYKLSDKAFAALALKPAGERVMPHAGRRPAEYRASDVAKAVKAAKTAAPVKKPAAAQKAARAAKTHGRTRKAAPKRTAKKATKRKR